MLTCVKSICCLLGLHGVVSPERVCLRRELFSSRLQSRCNHKERRARHQAQVASAIVVLGIDALNITLACRLLANCSYVDCFVCRQFRRDNAGKLMVPTQICHWLTGGYLS